MAWTIILLRHNFETAMYRPFLFIAGPTHFIYFIYLFIKTYLYRVVHNQTILILFYSVALFLAKSKSSDN